MGELGMVSPVFSGLRGREPEELLKNIETPCYIIDEAKLKQNCEILASLIKDTGCKILLAQKAFSNYDFYPLISGYLSGTEASGLYETKLGAEKMPGKEVHVFSAAYKESEFEQILLYADHIVFNSFNQLKKYGKSAKEKGKSIGMRINPQCSTQQEHAIYDPCAPGSRLGVTRDEWDKSITPELFSLIDGLHFHTLCEQNADDLDTTLKAVEEKFGDVLCKMKWLNMGGGHHITRFDYDLSLLKKNIQYAKNRWGVEVYLEPGEAVALNCGYLASRVLDIVTNGDIRTAVIDASAACHMPDVIEMPYTPPVYKAEATASEKSFRLAGPTCLAGDIIGDYTFDYDIKENSLVLFGDMAIYTTCKNNTFNGMALPSIYRYGTDGKLTLLKKFGYDDFECRLGKK